MAAKLALALTLVVLPLSAAIVLRGQTFLGSGMQPEVVARTLSSVQDEWKAQADVFAECNGTSGLPGASIVNCADAPSSFGKSCDTVVNAIVQGSGGDKDVAKEYMEDVCSQKTMSGWHQNQCHSLAFVVRGSMSADKYSNRASFDTAKLCTSFWSTLLDGEKHRIGEVKAEREAAEKKAAEEAAEQEKQDEAARKEEEERKKVEEAERVKQEAAAKAAEAKAEAEAKAAEAKERLAQKKAEAKAVQEAAKKKMEEAEEAEREQVAAKEAAEVKAKAAETKAPVTPPKPAAVPVEAKAAPAKVEATPTKVVEAKAKVAVLPAKAEAAAVKATPAKVAAEVKAAPAAQPVKTVAAKPKH